MDLWRPNPGARDGQSAELFAPDDAESGPDVVDRAHLVVDETEGEGDLADDVLGDVGGDPDARFGHATHNPPSGKIVLPHAVMRRARSARLVKNATITSAWRGNRAGAESLTPAGSGSSAGVKSSGAESVITSSASLTPSFLASGVPE